MMLEHEHPLFVRQEFDGHMFFHLSACDSATTKGPTWDAWSKSIVATTDSPQASKTAIAFACGDRVVECRSTWVTTIRPPPTACGSTGSGGFAGGYGSVCGREIACSPGVRIHSIAQFPWRRFWFEGALLVIMTFVQERASPWICLGELEGVFPYCLCFRR